MLTINKKTLLFLLFLVISSASYRFIDFSFKILTFDLSNSKSLTSLVEPVAALSFVSLGIFSGIVVDSISRKFFTIARLIGVFCVVVISYFSYILDFLNVYYLFICVFLISVLRTFSSASENSIFYDVCGDSNLSKKISYRSISLQVSAMLASLVIALYVGKEEFLLLISAFLLICCFIIFKLMNYEDQNTKQKFESIAEFLLFIKTESINFFSMTWKIKILRFMLLISFLKTFFVFWSMSSGALFKFGIESEETRGLYVLSMILMDIVSIVATFLQDGLKTYMLHFLSVVFYLRALVYCFSVSSTTKYYLLFL